MKYDGNNSDIKSALFIWDTAHKGGAQQQASANTSQ